MKLFACASTIVLASLAPAQLHAQAPPAADHALAADDEIDVRAFMAPGVPEHERNAALRKLWLSGAFLRSHVASPADDIANQEETERTIERTAGANALASRTKP